MKRRAWLLALGALLVGGWVLYAYRELFVRPFAADDYQWLLNVRGLGAAQLARTAFDPAAQTHFYRPLVWLLFWLQVRAFGLDPHGFHAVSLALHMLNAALAGWLAWRISGNRRQTTDERPPTKDEGLPTKEERTGISHARARLAGAFVAGAFVVLHPAPFEAVVWISAQSELLAAALLLAALHVWVSINQNNETGRQGNTSRLVSLSPLLLISTLALALALLAKESAVIGLPLLLLFGWGVRPPDPGWRERGRWLAPYAVPALLTLAYLALQVAVERRNYLLQAGGYGLGPQLLLNPLRSLALLVAPLPGTEHADNAWLVPLGALVALALLVLLAWCAGRLGRGGRLPLALLLALGLTLLPTAPFTSPPDSRYLYLPAMMVALLLALALAWAGPHALWASWRPQAVGSYTALLACLFALWWAGGELHLREWRFSAGAGPGGSLWQLAAQVCAQSHPERMLVVDPPLAAPHAEAIVGLACGPDVRPMIVGRDQIEDALRGHSVVIAFPNGSATVERTT